MSIITKPMLAGTLTDIKLVKYPVLATPKLDGVRCLKIDGKAVSRTWKPIANNFIRNHIEKHFPDGVDGELMIKSKIKTTEAQVFGEVSGPIMREEGEPDFTYNCFDYAPDLSKPYAQRVLKLLKLEYPRMKIVAPILVENEEDLLVLEKTFLDQGYEGVMIRSINGPYKLGRSTVKEGYLLKLKRFADSEAEIIGFEEQMHNANEATEDAFGRTKRSSHKANLIGKGTLGALCGRDIKTNVEFKCGTGFDDKMKKWIWDNRAKLLHKFFKYKFQVCGGDEKPRFPVFLEIRDPRDMS